MSDFDENKFKERLLQEAKINTPDLWGKIEAKLSLKDIKPMYKTNYKSKYIKSISGIAAILTLIIGISIYTHEKNTLTDIALKGDEYLDVEKLPSSHNNLTNNSPINYFDLNFPEGLTPAEKYSNKNEDIISSNLDIIPFSEDLLKDMTWMGKVTILDAYYKDYKYDTFSDKFEPNGILHNWLRTIVYEVKADEIYFDDGTIKTGDIFKIEQQCFNGCYLTDSALFDLKINHQYILPLFYAGNKILYEGSLDLENLAEGNINRDGEYSIIYSFAPQIEVTLDNEYLFPNGWETLINDKTVDVIMPPNSTEESIYADKIKLRNDDTFIDSLHELINRYK